MKKGIILIVLLVATWATFQANGGKPAVETNTQEKFKKSNKFPGSFRQPSIKSKPEQFVKETASEESYGLPEEFDYRKLAPSTPIKDQGDCGSCWAQAAVTIYEYFVRAHVVINEPFSVQEVIDCVTNKYNPNFTSTGCNGGDAMDALEYMHDNCLMTNERYPYIAKQNSKCQRDLPDNSCQDMIPRPKNGSDVSEIELQRTVFYNNPCVVTVCPKNKFENFTGEGVLEDDNPSVCDEKVLHSVVVLGWGTTSNGIKFWLIRNSKGTSWGQEGYGKIKRGDGFNHFGIRNDTSFFPGF